MLANPNSFYILEINQSTLFIKLKDIYHDCFHLIKGEPNLYPLFCLKFDCPRVQNCHERLLKRIKYIFDTFQKAEVLILYFTYIDKPDSHRGGVFWRDLERFKLITFNRSGWELLKKRGTIYQWHLPTELMLS